MGKEKAVIDTNVILSAMGWDGVPEKALFSLLSFDITPVFSDAQEKELLRVMDYVRMPASANRRKTEILTHLLRVSEHVTLTGVSGFVPADPNDDMIIDAALASGAKWIITGDHHLLMLNRFSGIRILTPQQFIETRTTQRS